MSIKNVIRYQIAGYLSGVIDPHKHPQEYLQLADNIISIIDKIKADDNELRKAEA